MHFELLKIGKNSRVESGINASLTVASSRHKIALHRGDIALMIVQNAGYPGVKGVGMRLN